MIVVQDVPVLPAPNGWLQQDRDVLHYNRWRYFADTR